MFDRRLHLATSRVAHLSLRGQVEAAVFAETLAYEIAVPVADVLARPRGERDRQLLIGAAFDVLEEIDGYAFGRSRRDGYCGWVARSALGAPSDVTHYVSSRATHLYNMPRVQAPSTHWVSFGSSFRVLAQEGDWYETPHGYIHHEHLAPLSARFGDPADVAARFGGVPYLWGGNSFMGIDCSGLIQTAFQACGYDCPADSDMQRSLGRAVDHAAPLQRGDVICWQGHVGMMLGSELLIHASGRSMAVVIEPLQIVVERIRELEGREILTQRRVLKDAVALETPLVKAS